MSHIIKIISERKRVQHIEHKREFQLVAEESFSGFSFPADKYGNVNKQDENYAFWQKNYEYCLSHPNEYEDLGVVEQSWWYTEPAVAKCRTWKRNASILGGII